MVQETKDRRNELRMKREIGANPMRSRHCDRERQDKIPLKHSFGKGFWCGELKSGELLISFRMILTADENS